MYLEGMRVTQVHIQIPRCSWVPCTDLQNQGEDQQQKEQHNELLILHYTVRDLERSSALSKLENLLLATFSIPKVVLHFNCTFLTPVIRKSYRHPLKQVICVPPFLFTYLFSIIIFQWNFKLLGRITLKKKQCH